MLRSLFQEFRLVKFIFSVPRKLLVPGCATVTLTEAIAPEFLKKTPITYIDTYDIGLELSEVEDADPSRISGGPQAVFSYLLQGFEQFTELELHVVSAHKELTDATGFRRGQARCCCIRSKTTAGIGDDSV